MDIDVVPVGMVRNISRPVRPVRQPTGVTVNWEQDKFRRVVSIAGQINSRGVAHLQSAIVDLGNRGLVIDLTQVSDIDAAAVAALADLRQRLAVEQLDVRTGLDSPAAQRLSAAT